MKKSLSFFLINILFLFIFFEIVLQTYYKLTAGDFLINRANLPIYENSKSCCWKLKKNLNISHKTSEFNYKIFSDDNSFRIKNYSKKNFELKKGKTLVLMGPSFGFGWGVDYEKSYANLIGNFYEKNNFSNIINASVPGHIPTQQLCWFLKEGYKLKPDIIVQTLTSKPQLYLPEDENLDVTDFCNNFCNPNLIVENGILKPNNTSLFSNPKWLLKNSATIFYGWYFVSKINSYFITDKEITKSAIGLEFQNLDNFTKKNYKKTYKNYLKFIKQKSSKTKVIFIYIPDSYNVHIKDRARWSHQNIDFDQSLEGYQNNVKMLSDTFNFVDTFPALLKEAKNQRLYYYVDTHFNEIGNKITFENFKNYCNTNNCF